MQFTMVMKNIMLNTPGDFIWRRWHMLCFFKDLIRVMFLSMICILFGLSIFRYYYIPTTCNLTATPPPLSCVPSSTSMEPAVSSAYGQVAASVSSAYGQVAAPVSSPYGQVAAPVGQPGSAAYGQGTAAPTAAATVFTPSFR